ncbi:ATP-binding protein [Thalassospira sp. NFXS8]|uniref:AAA family ATPase n=1 Tax=Thalassospira sp. NFXS8 TaxID=2819093 RepID=UPI0032DF4016
MSNAKQILAMLRSRAEDDDEQFYSIALQIAASEARQGRRTTAEALRGAVEEARSRSRSGVPIQFAQPRGDLESIIEFREPRYVLKDVVLNSRLCDRLDDLVRQQTRRDWLREHGKTPNRRVLFLGPPGSGKTMTAEALAGQLRLPLFVVRLEALITRYMGETAAKLRLVFDETAKRRGVFLFDEFDAVGGRRSATNDVAEMRRVLNSFLQYMEEESSTDSLVVGATNHPELLDKALLRRFDLVLTFDMPSEDDIKRIITIGLRPFKVGRLTWTKIFPAAAGLSQAEIAKAAEDAVKAAILDERNSVTTEQLSRRLQERREMQEAFLTTRST